ncbi:MAG: sigma-54-dependent transcriptional regulator [Bacteriovorax sp.]
MRYRILAIDDDNENLQATSLLLEEWNYKVDTATSGAEGIEKIKSAGRDYAIILLDYKMPIMNGAETAEKIREINAESIILIYSCDNTRSALKDTFRAGAVDFIDKDEKIENLQKSLELACQRFEEGLKLHRPIVNKAHNAELLQSVGMVGQSQKMADVVLKCLNYRKYDQPVLILGETGSGKELVAKAIHGEDKDRFYAVNCAAFGDGNLIEAELFGYEKGAFTGATNRKVGILEAAGFGTVFLDELNHLSLKAQGTLLRALREKKIRRVGATVEINISCRILAACKPDLLSKVEQGLFLPDLYYRLKFLTVDVPSLRERPEDIGLLVEHFARRFQKTSDKKVLFRAKVIRIFEKYEWRGNVGELEGCVSELLVNSKSNIIGPADLDAKFRALDILDNPTSTLADLELKHEAELRQLISTAINLAGSRRRAALRLGVNESSLRAMVERLRIKESHDLLC